MRSIKVKVSDLLTILKENREKHKKAMDEIMEAYRQKVIQELDKALKAAKEGKYIITDINLERPLNMTKAYTVAIGMLEMCVESYIEISEVEYKNYVLDEWHWSSSVSSSSSSYVSSSTSSSTTNYLKRLASLD